MVNGDASYALDLAADELFTNCVKHNPKGGGEIVVEYAEPRDNVAAIRVTDPDCQKFDPLGRSLPSMEQLAVTGTTHGRGLYLVRQLVDDLQYTYRNGCGSITVTKRVGRDRGADNSPQAERFG